MRILALETSGLSGSIAALDDDRLLTEVPLNPSQRSARSLAPGLAELWRRVGWRPLEVNLVAVTVGPGSFTGLRVGVTAAKVLAYAAKCEILGISTLEAIAARAPNDAPRLSVAIDAQRGEVLVQSFRRADAGLPEPIGPEKLVRLRDWLDELPADFAITGPILRKTPIASGRMAIDPQLWDPSAAAVGRLAWLHYRAGQRDDIWSIAPRYSRRAAAEEKWEQRSG